MSITDYIISYLALSATGGLLQLCSIWGFSSLNSLFEAVCLLDPCELLLSGQSNSVVKKKWSPKLLG